MILSTTPLGQDKIKIRVKCPFCGKISEVTVSYQQYVDWTTLDLHVQDAFPEESPETRELLLTGICNDCWTVTFADDEDDNDY